MAIKPPNQTLEPGSQMWRRFVEDNIIGLDTGVRVLSDSVDNAHIGTQGAINQLGQQIARLTEVTNRLDQQQQELTSALIRISESTSILRQTINITAPPSTTETPVLGTTFSVQKPSWANGVVVYGAGSGTMTGSFGWDSTLHTPVSATSPPPVDPTRSVLDAWRTDNFAVFGYAETVDLASSDFVYFRPYVARYAEGGTGNHVYAINAFFSFTWVE